MGTHRPVHRAGAQPEQPRPDIAALLDGSTEPNPTSEVPHQRPDRTAGLDLEEAVADGTALIGQTDPEQTDRFGQDGARPPNAHEIGTEWNRISLRLADLFMSGVADNDPRTQQAIHEHYRWICHFWTPDRDSYLRLAGLYVNQPKFRKRIERKKPAGLAAYMRDAMNAYAWSRLR